MKKVILIPIIIGGVLLVAGSAIFAVAISKHSYAKAVTNEYVIEESFNNIDIDVDITDVTFVASQDNSCKVVCQETSKYYHEVKANNDTLYIKSYSSKKWYDFMSFNVQMKATVYVPAKEYNDFKLKSSTGDIVIPQGYAFASYTSEQSTGKTDVKANVTNAMSVKTSTGNIYLSDVNCNSLKVTASTGNINISKTEVVEAINVKTSTGNIKLEDTHCKNFTSSASTGTTSLINSVAQEHIEIKASTGNVKFDGADAETLDIKTSTGDVKGTLLTTKIFDHHTDTGKVKLPPANTWAGGVCKIETDTGDIEISIKA